MFGTTAALLGSAAISGGTSLLGGLFGSHAANNAAKGLTQAAQQAGAKVEGAIGAVNPSIGEAATNVGTNVTGQALNAGKNLIDAAQQAGTTVQDQAAKSAALLNPYSKLGSQSADALAAGLEKGGVFNNGGPNAADFTSSPDYQFRIAQGLKALQQRGSAVGDATGGTAVKDTLNFAGGLAGTEFGNWWDRQTRLTKDLFERESGTAKIGMDAAGKQAVMGNDAASYAGDKFYSANQTAGTWNTNAAQYAGDKTYDAANTMANNTISGAKTAADYLTQGANAAAAGKIGSANALATGASGAANAVSGGLSLAAILKAIKLNQPRVGDIPDNIPGSSTTIPRVASSPGR